MILVQKTRKLGVIWVVTHLDAGALSPRCEIYVVSNGNSDIYGIPSHMMEGECLLSVEGKAGTDLDAICSCFAAWSTWCTLWVVTGALALILVVLHSARKWLLRKFEWLKTFYVWIGVLAVLGGAWAFLFPLAINADFSKNGDGAALRQTLIYTTGGLLGVITLGETRHKNDQEHMRQVHAERRSRYATAIEQLADEKAPIRLGGVYTLVKLVDDWLADKKTLPNEKERREEGQVIVNSLCAYIRSQFDLASRAEVLSQNQTPENYEGGVQQFVKDQARFREEKELRLTILEAIRTRLNSGTIAQDNGTERPIKGPWSNFDYNFSNAVFFYPTDFRSSLFGNSSNFFQATFTVGASFSNVKFTRSANFSGAIFIEHANFPNVKFTRSANFSNTVFITNQASFVKATFNNFGNFFKANFKIGHAIFSGATFTGDVNFSETIFQNRPQFKETLGDKTKTRFSNKIILNYERFKVALISPYKIETEEQEHNRKKFIIPKGAELFDPDKPSEQEDNDDS